MAKTIKIEPRTLRFIEEHKRLKELGRMPKHADLIKILGINSATTISEILGKRQNIHQPEWEKFKLHFDISEINSEYPVRNSQNNEQKDQQDDKKEIFLHGPIKMTAQEYVDSLKSDKQQLQEVITTSLAAIQLMLNSLRRHDQAYHETILRSLARLEKKKPEDVLILEAHTRDVALLLEEKGTDIAKEGS